MKQFVLLFFVLSLAGCAPRSGIYPYRVMNDDCWCDRYEIRDRDAGIVYFFAAHFNIRSSVHTTITVEILNESIDTLDLSLAYVKVSSRNVRYTHNDRSIPVGIPLVPPGGTRTLTLQGDGRETTDEEAWLHIAGEQLTVTLKGMRIRMRELATQEVLFTPHNPKLGATRLTPPGEVHSYADTGTLNHHRSGRAS